MLYNHLTVSPDRAHFVFRLTCTKKKNQKPKTKKKIRKKHEQKKRTAFFSRIGFDVTALRLCRAGPANWVEIIALSRSILYTKQPCPSVLWPEGPRKERERERRTKHDLTRKCLTFATWYLLVFSFVRPVVSPSRRPLVCPSVDLSQFLCPPPSVLFVLFSPIAVASSGRWWHGQRWL